jgi:hypothetical protein
LNWIRAILAIPVSGDIHRIVDAIMRSGGGRRSAALDPVGMGGGSGLEL